MRLTTLKSLPGYFALIFSLILSGCGDGRVGPPTVPVSGTVLMDDKPLANAEVHFDTEEFGVVARTNAEGKFQFEGGAVAGENKVYITKWEGEFDLNPDEGMDEGQFEAMGGTPGEAPPAAKADTGPKQLIPAQYSDPEKTTLTFTVPAEGTEAADFKITSK